MNKKKYIAPEMTLLIMEQLMVTGASVQGISDPNKTSSLSWGNDSEQADAEEAW